MSAECGIIAVCAQESMDVSERLHSLIDSCPQCGSLVLFFKADAVSEEEISRAAALVENQGGREVMLVPFHGQFSSKDLISSAQSLVSAGYAHAVLADLAAGYTARDINTICQQADEHPSCLVTAARNHLQMDEKVRSSNKRVCRILQIVCHVKVHDALTGLVCLPLAHVAQATNGLSDNDDAFAYLLTQSAYLFDEAAIVEASVETIADEQNSAQVSDAFKETRSLFTIYKTVLGRFPKYLASSLSSRAIDYLIFGILYYLVIGVAFYSAIGARVVSSIINYLLNKKLVFKGIGKKYRAWNYFLLAAGILAVNSALLALFVDTLGLPAIPVKIVVDVLLYFVNFTVQNNIAHRN